MNNAPLATDLINLLAARRGHFRLESGHHGELWLDLDALFLRPASLRPFAADLARQLAAHQIEAVCGPLTGGAFVAQMIASELDVAFCYAEPVAPPRGAALYSAEYRTPDGLRRALHGQRVAVVDDVINAGSAVRATVADVRACGGRVVAVGALLVLGTAAGDFASNEQVPLESVARMPNDIWAPGDCPLCAAGVALEDASAKRR